MSDIRVLKGDGKRAEDVTGELHDRIKAPIYEYEFRIPLASAIGVLHLVAYESQGATMTDVIKAMFSFALGVAAAFLVFGVILLPWALGLSYMLRWLR